MAFGKKFYSSYKSNNNLDYYLEVWIEGHTGGNTELTMGAGGPVIEYETDQEDRFSPIISSSCKIPYLVEDNIDSAFVDTLRTTYQERQVYIHIYRASSSTYHTVAPLWSGFLVMDLGEGQDKSFPYVQELKFVDGLALLKDIDFVDLNVAGGTPPFEERVQGNYAEENMYFGPATYIYWFREILAKTGASLTAQGSTLNYGFTTSVNWYNGDMNSTGQSSDPLHKTKCQVSMFHRKDDQEVYFPDNCYNVLKELLRHWGARITYWKHEFYIVQIPEYITGESGTIDNPQNNFSRVYSNTGSYQGSQDHLGSTYWTRYFQEISNTKISKLTGTKYEYLPIVKQVNADFLSFSSKSVFGGFPFGATALQQEVFQGTLNSPSTADFLWLSIPLDWAWNCPNFPSGHTNGWWSSIKFNFYASDGTTTYYLQFDSTSNTLPYYWVDSANWTPLGNKSPRYIISSKSLNVTAHVGFEQSIPFKDSSGNAITMTGAWSFYLDLHSTGTSTGYGNSGSNAGCFYLNFSGYGSPQRMRNPNVGIVLPTPSGPLNSGTVSWSNSLQDSQGSITISTITNPSGFNAGTSQDDIRFATTSPFLGLLQLLTDGQSAAFGQSYNTLNTSSAAAKANSDQFDFDRLLWGDSTEFARSSLQVFDGSNYVNTTASGLWGRGTLTGSKTFTQLLLDEFLYGQTKIIISPSMRLIVGEQNKNETQGSATRPRYVNPIGKLRETRDGTDPEYFFRRGSFYTLLDEWDYEGYQIIRNEVTTTNQNNSIGSSGGNQSNAPNNSAMMPNPTTQALAQNSPLAYISQTIPATGSNVAVNGNFNVATGWTLGTGWTIDTTTKQAKFAATGSTSELVQSVLTQELTYQINFQVDVTAGTLLVKAGTTGQSQTITSSGDYSIYLTCEGSSDIKFQAGTTFTGSITYITLRDQKSLSSVPINEIGSAVFKTGDTFNLINSNSDEILALTVTSNQGSSDTSISVSSTPLYDDIDAGSYLLINQDDLSAQYQNKTKGTVGGFDITATSIDSGSVAISSYIDDDSFGTASATSLATSESIKAYVDTQVGSADTLQEVTDLGNTTTNSIRIGSSSAPAGGVGLHVDSEIRVDGNDGVATKKIRSSYFSSSQNITIESGSSANIIHNIGSTEKMRLTSDGRLGIGVTNPSRFLSVNSANENFVAQFTSNDDKASILLEDDDTLNYIHSQDGYLSIGGGNALSTTNLNINSTNGNTGFGTVTPTEKLHVVGDALITGDSHADAFKPAVSGNPIKFKNFDSSTEFARITNGGNLLIGTTTDSGYKLQVDGHIKISSEKFLYLGGNANGFGSNSNSSPIIKSNNGNIFFNSDSSDNINIYLQPNGGEIGDTAKIHFNSRAVVGWFNSAVYLGDNGQNKDIKLQVNSSDIIGLTSNTERFRVKSGGNFLIGTTTDDGSSKLQVNGDITAQEVSATASSYSAGQSEIIYKAQRTGGAVAGDWSYDDATTDMSLGTSTSHSFSLKTGNTRRLTIDNSGFTTLTGSLTGTTATFSTAVNTTSSLNFTGNNAYIKVGSTWNTGVLNFLNGATTYLQFDVPNNRIKNNLGSYLTASSNTAKFGSFDNYSVAFVANNLEKMRLTADGKLGISTTSPTEELSVSGDANITGKLAVGSSSAHPSFAFYNQLTSYFNGAVTIDDSFTQTGGSTSTFSGHVILGTTGNRLEFTNGNVGLYRGEGANLILGGYDGIIFRSSNSGITTQSERMRLTSAGNLLIGTTTDSGDKLRVNGDVRLSNSSKIYLYADHNLNFLEYYRWESYTSSLMHISNAGTGGVGFFTNGSERARITSSGNLLIGTTTDDGAKLSVEGSVIIRPSGQTYYNEIIPSSNISSYSNTSQSQQSGIVTAANDGTFKSRNVYAGTNIGSFNSNGTVYVGAFSYGNVNYLTGHNSYDHIFKQNNSTTLMTIKGNGNVLINTTTDDGSSKLQVEGDVKVNDGHEVMFGNDADLKIKHDNSDAFIRNFKGDFYILNAANNKDIIFQSDDGSGGIADYIRLDGSQTTVNVYKTLLIGTTTNTGLYKIDVAGKQRVQSVLELEDVLTLNAISTPSDPANNKSSIYMDSADGSIKVKINVGGTVVTRTIASFE